MQHYQKNISRDNPSAILILVDQSGSMSENIYSKIPMTKMQAVADVVNRILREIYLRCQNGTEVRDYFHVGIIGYGGLVRNLLDNNAQPVPVSQLEERTIRIEQRKRSYPDGAGGLIELEEDFPIWLEQYAGGNTPMCAALNRAGKMIETWVAEHPDSFPPLVFNITDGQANDEGNPLDFADRLRSIGGSDGNALLFNLHLSSTAADPDLFPDCAPDYDPFALQLYNMSSELPEGFLPIARESYPHVKDGARGFAFNTDLVALINFLNIGTMGTLANTGNSLVPVDG